MTRRVPVNQPLGSNLRTTPILKKGVTHTYLIVKVKRRISFTGNASSTLTAKNWNVRYCKRLVRASSFRSNSFFGKRFRCHEARLKNGLGKRILLKSTVISQWKKSAPIK